MQRFFHPAITEKVELISIVAKENQELYNQLTRVLRYHPGDRVAFFSGDGIDREFAIQSITGKEVVLVATGTNVSRASSTNTPKIRIIQALPNKLEKLELVVQKCTEIGVSELCFYPSNRSQVSDIGYAGKHNKYSAQSKVSMQSHGLQKHENSSQIALEDSLTGDEYKNFQRLNKICIEAVEQSFSGMIPKLKLFRNFEESRQYCLATLDTTSGVISDTAPSVTLDVTSNVSSDIVLFAHTTQVPGIETVRGIISSCQFIPQWITLYIGPEGGWSDDEVERFITEGYAPISFGENILRTETACICGAFMLKSLSGYLQQ